jgi:hypothetical protein
VEADEVLKRSGRRRPPGLEVELTQVDTVDGDGSERGIVEATEQLD